MKLIIGLGNIAKGYEKTRHNAGFLFLDYLYNFPGALILKKWYKDAKLEAEIAHVELLGQSLILAKPQTNMNDSGRAVSKILASNPKIGHKQDLIVVYDDTETALGKVKRKEAGSAGGHNGIRSIMAYIGGAFLRIKIGIGRPSEDVDMSDFVLGKFTPKELDVIGDSFTEAWRVISEEIEGVDSSKNKQK